jgi:serine O-acetyltransferase
MATHIDRLGLLTGRLAAAMPTAYTLDQGVAPDRDSVASLCRHLLWVMFPGIFSGEGLAPGRLEPYLLRHVAELEGLLMDLSTRSLVREIRRHGGDEAKAVQRARDLTLEVIEELPDIRGLLSTDVDAAFHNDPAAQDKSVIVLSYPCIEALAVQRFAHRLYQRHLHTLARMMTEWAHGRTGIDIHPGATIDESFFIDHGTGVVIGETSRIGKHCVLYQGVGLVAWNPLAKGDDGTLQRGDGNKRHPDLEDHVTIYAGATILGGDTVIGHHSVIGGSVWLTHSVEPYSAVTIKNPELSIRKRRQG